MEERWDGSWPTEGLNIGLALRSDCTFRFRYRYYQLLTWFIWWNRRRYLSRTWSLFQSKSSPPCLIWKKNCYSGNRWLVRSFWGGDQAHPKKKTGHQLMEGFEVGRENPVGTRGWSSQNDLKSPISALLPIFYFSCVFWQLLTWYLRDNFFQTPRKSAWKLDKRGIHLPLAKHNIPWKLLLWRSHSCPKWEGTETTKFRDFFFFPMATIFFNETFLAFITQILQRSCYFLITIGFVMSLPPIGTSETNSGLNTKKLFCQDKKTLS